MNSCVYPANTNGISIDSITKFVYNFVIKQGAYSFPVVLAAKIAVRTVARFLHENPDSFDLVEWVLLRKKTYLNSKLYYQCIA